MVDGERAIRIAHQPVVRQAVDAEEPVPHRRRTPARTPAAEAKSIPERWGPWYTRASRAAIRSGVGSGKACTRPSESHPTQVRRQRLPPWSRALDRLVSGQGLARPVVEPEAASAQEFRPVEPQVLVKAALVVRRVLHRVGEVACVGHRFQIDAAQACPRSGRGQRLRVRTWSPGASRGRGAESNRDWPQAPRRRRRSAPANDEGSSPRA